MPTLIGSYVFTCSLVTRVLLSDPNLVRQMQIIQQLQEMSARLKALQEEL